VPIFVNVGYNGGGLVTAYATVFLAQGNHSFISHYWQNGKGDSGFNIILPAGVTAVPSGFSPTKTVAQNSLRLLLDYANASASDSPATEAVIVPAVFVGPASTASPTPLITTQPASLSVAPQGTAVFSVTAISSLALSYQWYFNSTPISNGNLSTLTINSVSSSDAGNYYVAVTNGNGSTISVTVTLTVT
jgi:hypothetical protein